LVDQLLAQKPSIGVLGRKDIEHVLVGPLRVPEEEDTVIQGMEFLPTPAPAHDEGDIVRSIILRELTGDYSLKGYLGVGDECVGYRIGEKGSTITILRRLRIKFLRLTVKHE